MKTRRSSLAEKPVAAAESKLRKVTGKTGSKGGARKLVVHRKVVLKRKDRSASGSGRRSTRSNSRRPPSTAAAAAAATETEATATAEPCAAAGQQATGRRQRTARRASVIAACCGDTTISDLSAETLQEVFFKLSAHQAFCREILPLVCKRFRELLRQPSPVWQELHINFLEKGAVLAAEPGGQEEDSFDPSELTSRRRLLRSAVEKWLRPRALAVKKLVLMFSSADPTHSFSTAGHGLRPLFRLLPGLQDLRIIGCSDIFHGASFSDLGGLQHLQTLAVTSVTGKLTAQELAPLEQLKQLRSFTLHCTFQAEEMSGAFLGAFPDALLKLKNLRELALTSRGITHVPPGITRLKNLEALDVSGTAVTFLPQNLWRLSELRHVRLNGTGMVLSMMHAWEALAKLPRLEVLELRETKTRSLPVNLNGLKALTRLDLSDNIFEHGMHQGEDALSCLQHLPALKRLEMRRSQLSTVPAVCCHLSGLTHLDLSHNFLVDLPEGLWLMRSLKELLAQGNTFPRIPEVLHRLPSLEVADLSFCIYMEAATPLVAQAADGFKAIRSLDLRKMLGVWKDSSVKWLKQLDTALLAQGRPNGVLQF